MRESKKSLFFILYSLFIFSADAESFLTAQSFPKTINDLSFTERMAVLKEGYEPYEIKFDVDGNCVSGCAFQQMNIEDTEDYYARQTEIANATAVDIRAQHPEWTSQVAVTPSVPTSTYQSERPTAVYQCPVSNPYNAKISSRQTVPSGYPLDGPVYVTSSYGLRSAPATKNGRSGSTRHQGVDLRASTGTPVYSTLSGTVVTAGYSGDCGNMVKIKSIDGFAVGYCHLDKIFVAVGDVVQGGCVLGLAGNTGNSGGAHLHYIIYNQNNAQVCPSDYLPMSQNTSSRPACSIRS